MSDRPINRDPGSVRDDDGNVYDIEGDRAKSAPGDPRDASAGYPTSGFVAGGAGGTGSMGAASASGTSSAAPGSTSDLRAASESGPHGTVAESADLGQRPLADYKREGDAAVDATETTVGAGTMSSDPADARPAGSYTSDDDAVGSTGAGATRPARGSSSGTTNDLGTGSGTIAASTDDTTSTSGTGRVVTGARDANASGRRVDAGARVTNARDTGARDVGTRDTDTRDVGSGGGGISASTNNSGALGAAVPTTLSGVSAGYRVVDANGDDVGKVRDVRSGDVGAATTGGSDDGYDEGVEQSTDSTVGVASVPTGVGTGTGGSGTGVGVPAVVATDTVDDQAGAYGDGEPNIDEPAFTRLSRTGFIKIDAKGWFASDRYAGADQVDRVEGETVYLSAGKDDLISER